MKKEQATSNITFIALMVAINAIFALLNAFVPMFFFFLILLLPLTTTFTIILCKPKYYVIYYFASLIICYLINFNGPEYILFTLLPSLITGTIFGLLIEKKATPVTLILSSTIAYMSFTLLTIPLINFIYEVNMFKVYQELLQIDSKIVSDLTFLPFVFALSLVQMTITLFITTNEMKKFQIDYSLNITKTLPISIWTMLFAVLSIIAIFVYYRFTYLFFAMAIMGGTILIAHYVSKKTKFIITYFISSIIITFFLFAILYSCIDKLYISLVFMLPFLLFAVLDILLNLLKKGLLLKQNSAKIEERGEDNA